jgi:hypothetical protein
VDDAQWLDRVSGQTLAFVARRLLAERVGLVFALREPDDEHELEGLPGLAIHGLADDNARLLLDATIPGPLDRAARRLPLASGTTCRNEHGGRFAEQVAARRFHGR